MITYDSIAYIGIDMNTYMLWDTQFQTSLWKFEQKCFTQSVVIFLSFKTHNYFIYFKNIGST